MSVIIANIIILFASVAFLIVKAAWQVILPICLFILAYMVENKFWKWKFDKSFSSWRALILQKLSSLGTKKPPLKTTYIIFATIIGFALFILFIALYYQLFNIILGKAKTTISTIDSNFALAFLGTVSGGVAIFTGYMAILRSGTNERETRTAEEGLITDRLNKATEGLGKKDGDNPVIEVRLGALYALERIAQDSLRDHVQIMEILCAYIRHNSPLKNDNKSVREDIQAALTIIGRRGNGEEGKERLKQEYTQSYRIDLSGCNLRSASLDDANLNRAILYRTNMTYATLIGTQLVGVRFSYTNLTHSGMNGTNLAYTDFENAITTLAMVLNCSLSESNIDKKQLDQMFCAKNVDIPSQLKSRPRHWPKVKLSEDDFMEKYWEWREKNKPLLAPDLED